MTIPGLTTKCENFLYKLTIENASGTGKGSLTEMPLYNCTTNSKVCTVKTIGAEKLPWASHLATFEPPTTSSSKGSKSASSTPGNHACWGKPWSPSPARPAAKSTTRRKPPRLTRARLSATKTELKALGQKIEWNGLFPTEAFQWHREQALSVS